MTENGVPSPYAPTEMVDRFREMLGNFLASLRVPIPAKGAHTECSRDCHLIERNYMVEIVRDFLFKH